MAWEIVIGLETHVQLATRSKIFSGASSAFGAAPNSAASVVDLGLPGTLPVLNREVVEKALRFAVAIGARVNARSIFARKNYFYPDLPKGYQISQYELPIVCAGKLAFRVGGMEKTVSITRAHLEEDAGKSLHEEFADRSGIDLNRAGTPLLEIVTEPELRSAADAVAYAKTLHTLVMWNGLSDGNMQEGSFRCDANVSVRPSGEAKLGTRCEVKNLNSFRFLEQAIEYEARRQIELLEDGGRIVQETRLYDPERNETRPMRSKEDAMDYRYFPDPDLLPLIVDREWIERVAQSMPEQPAQAAQRLVAQHGLTVADAAILTSSRALFSYYDEVVKVLGGESKLAASWVLGEVLAALNRGDGRIENALPAAQLAGLLKRIKDGTISGKIAKELFAAMGRGEGDADAIIERQGLRQVSDRGDLAKIVDQVLDDHPQQVADYRAGKQKAFNALVGQVMKATGGKANPQQVNGLLKEKLA